jgi:O-antigen ligase
MIMTNQTYFSPRFWTTLLLAFLAIYAFLVGFWFSTDTIFATPEMGWIFPRVLLLGLVAFIGLLQIRSIKEYLNFFSILLLVQLVLAAISTFLPNDALQLKLLGPDRRMDGFLYHIGLTFFGLLVYRLAATKNIVWLVTNTLTIVGFVEAIIVILQRLGIDLYSILLHGLPANRINGSLGHYGYVAGFLLVPLFMGFYSFWTAKSRFKVLVTISMVLMAIAIGITTTRTAYFAMLVALPFVLFIKRDLITLALLIVVGIVPSQVNWFVPNPTGIAAERQYTDTSTLTTRLMFWNIAQKVAPTISGMPLIGGGPDAFKLAIIKSLPIDDYLKVVRLEYAWPEDTQVESFKVLAAEDTPLRSRMLLVLFSHWSGEGKPGRMYNYELDKAHNFIIDRILSYGLLNALIWIVLYAAPLFFAFRSKELEQKILGVTILAVAIFYQAWFPVVPVEPYHLTLVALAWGIWQGTKQPNTQLSSITLSTLFSRW